MFHVLNGKVLPESEMKVSVWDMGFIRGVGVFDYLITYNQKPFHLRDHVERLFRSASSIGLNVPESVEEIEAWTHQALEANRGEKIEKGIRLMITGGIGPDAFTVSPERPTVVIMIEPRGYLKPELYQNGAKLMTVEHLRYMPGAKTTNYIEGVRQMALCRQMGAIESLFVHQGRVLEVATSNVFAVINDILVTPREDVLLGITRKVIVENLELSLPIVERELSVDEMFAAQEFFIASSVKEVVPITQIDDRKIADGRVGPVSKEVMSAFRQYTEAYSS